MKITDKNISSKSTVYLWIALATCLILMIPAVCMFTTDQVNWTWMDFVVMGILLFSTGTAIVIASKFWRGWRRAVVSAFIVFIFLYIWMELAVGIFLNFGS